MIIIDGTGAWLVVPDRLFSLHCTFVALIATVSASHGVISRAEMWLAQTPEGVEQCVWDVVVAITAMEQCRRFMAATLAGDPQEAPGPSLLERAITRVGLIFGAGFGDLRPSVFRERGGSRWARDALF
jgi:hypothetical protein